MAEPMDLFQLGNIKAQAQSCRVTAWCLKPYSAIGGSKRKRDIYRHTETETDTEIQIHRH